jgi:hypothetical protein
MSVIAVYCAPLESQTDFYYTILTVLSLEKQEPNEQ